MLLAEPRGEVPGCGKRHRCGWFCKDGVVWVLKPGWEWWAAGANVGLRNELKPDVKKDGDAGIVTDK